MTIVGIGMIVLSERMMMRNRRILNVLRGHALREVNEAISANLKRALSVAIIAIKIAETRVHSVVLITKIGSLSSWVKMAKRRCALTIIAKFLIMVARKG